MRYDCFQMGHFRAILSPGAAASQKRIKPFDRFQGSGKGVTLFAFVGDIALKSRLAHHREKMGQMGTPMLTAHDRAHLFLESGAYFKADDLLNRFQGAAAKFKGHMHHFRFGIKDGQRGAA